MTTVLFSRKDIADYLCLSQSRLVEIIKESGVQCENKKGNVFLYTFEEYSLIKEFINNKRFNLSKVEIFNPVYITQTFYIFESKTNGNGE